MSTVFDQAGNTELVNRIYMYSISRLYQIASRRMKGGPEAECFEYNIHVNLKYFMREFLKSKMHDHDENWEA